jgi:hypothetical protein
MAKVITVDIERLAKLMRDKGFDGSDDEAGWTDTLMDLLEYENGVESQITIELRRMVEVAA